MTPTTVHVDRTLNPPRLRISLDAGQAQLLAYALRIFNDEMRIAGDPKALDYAKSMERLHRDILQAL